MSTQAAVDFSNTAESLSGEQGPLGPLGSVQEEMFPVTNNEWSLGLFSSPPWAPSMTIFPGRHLADKVRPILIERLKSHRCTRLIIRVFRDYLNDEEALQIADVIQQCDSLEVIQALGAYNYITQTGVQALILALQHSNVLHLDLDRYPQGSSVVAELKTLATLLERNRAAVCELYKLPERRAAVSVHQGVSHASLDCGLCFRSGRPRPTWSPDLHKYVGSTVQQQVRLLLKIWTRYQHSPDQKTWNRRKSCWRIIKQSRGLQCFWRQEVDCLDASRLGLLKKPLLFLICSFL